MTELGPLALALSRVKETEVLNLVQQGIRENVPALDLLAQCYEGMTELGKRFGRGDCFIPELIVASKIMEKVMAVLDPFLKSAADSRGKTGTVVMGTVQYDIHNLGKDIVVTILRGSGFNVVDLGVDVPPAKFVQAIREHQPIAVGLSVLLTTCYKSIKETVEAIKQEGLRDQVSIMLGGAAASPMLVEMTGCDFYGKTPIDAVNHAAALAGG